MNKTNFGGNTALHSAVVNTGERAKELCAILVEHGADPTIPNHNRESSEVFVINFHQVIRLLLMVNLYHLSSIIYSAMKKK